ncbi:hypothetical protein DXG01_011708 [Tephrocybe rancida]|nr:hypothetical protein DXG01_011708 [Tephrocybe rancida]
MSEPTAPPAGSGAPPGVPPGLDLTRILGPQVCSAILLLSLDSKTTLIAGRGSSKLLSLGNSRYPRPEDLMIDCIDQIYTISHSLVTTESSKLLWFAAGFGNLARIQNPLTSPINTPFMGSIMALVVQLFFCYRIFIINRSAWWWCLLIGAVSIIQAVAGAVGGIKALVVKDISKRHNQTDLVYLWLVGDVVADVMIAATMTFSLLRASPGKHKQTNDVVTRIVRLTVETNSLTITFNNRAFLANKMQSSSYAASSVNQSRSTRTRTSTITGNYPISAGLKFSDNADFDDNVEHIMITQQSATIGDTETGVRRQQYQ